MPKNKSKNAIIPDGSIPDAEPADAAQEAAPAENAWVAFERGRVSRRQALKKLGMTSAMATFALFSVDDLARMVGKAMQQRAADNKVVEQVAREFQNAGVAFAAYPGDPNYQACLNCVNTKNTCLADADTDKANCLKNAGSNVDQQNVCNAVYVGQYRGCEYSAIYCCSENNCNC